MQLRLTQVCPRGQSCSFVHSKEGRKTHRPRLQVFPAGQSESVTHPAGDTTAVQRPAMHSLPAGHPALVEHPGWVSIRQSPATQCRPTGQSLLVTQANAVRAYSTIRPKMSPHHRYAAWSKAWRTRNRWSLQQWIGGMPITRFRVPVPSWTIGTQRACGPRVSASPWWSATTPPATIRSSIPASPGCT